MSASATEDNIVYSLMIWFFENRKTLNSGKFYFIFGKVSILLFETFRNSKLRRNPTLTLSILLFSALSHSSALKLLMKDNSLSSLLARLSLISLLHLEKRLLDILFILFFSALSVSNWVSEYFTFEKAGRESMEVSLFLLTDKCFKSLRHYRPVIFSIRFSSTMRVYSLAKWAMPYIF